MVPIRVLTVALIFVASVTPGADAQVRFAGGATESTGQVRRADHQADIDSGRQNPFRGDQQVRPAAYAQPQFSPQVPSAADEASSVMSGPVQSVPSVVESEGSYVELPAPGGYEPAPLNEFGEFVDAPYEQMAVDPSAAVVFSTNDTFRRGYWYSQQDVVLLLRTELEETLLSSDQTDPSAVSNRPFMDTKSVAPTFVPGTRLTLGRFLGQDVVNRDYAIEVTFLGLFDYENRASITSVAPNSLETGIGPSKYVQFVSTISDQNLGIVGGSAVPGYTFADTHRVLYSSDMNNLEANLRIMGRPMRDRLALQPNGSWVQYGSSSRLTSMLIGLRGMSINELLQFSGIFEDDVRNRGFYQVKTSNDLFGVQIGGELVDSYTNWSWGFRTKAGGLFNFSSRDSFLDTLSNNVPEVRDQQLDGENLAVVVEAGMVATYHLRPNLVARLAYDAMYITGIATAPQNLRLGAEFPRYEVTGDAIFHGMSVGFEMLW